MEANASADIAFAFGPFELIPRKQTLLRHNQPVKLGGRALDILHLLLMRAGEEVSKDEIIDYAWPNVFVGDPNVKVHISNLRRALDDSHAQAIYIATVVGRGYKFVGQVRMERPTIAKSNNNPSQPIPCSLPSPRNLVGRQHQVAEIALTLDSANIVTLVGHGGVGKTSLAISAAYSMRERFPHGIHFVDLSAIQDPAFVPHLIATCLGVRGDPTDLMAGISDYLGNRSVLVVLDNCEHVLQTAAMVAARFADPKLSSRVLATSREPLRIVGEKLHHVEPLDFPKPGQVQSAAEAMTYPSFELFALRAFEKTGYKFADQDVQAVATLCQALDGLPLALEIAAANINRFSPAAFLESFGRRLIDLQNEQEDIHPRHLTLWATLDWSYQLLSLEESTVFRLLSVYAGSFESSDVAAMARLVQYDPYRATLALGGLVAKSLVSAETDGDQLSYRLTQSARHYAAERLSRDPLAQNVRRHHAQLVLSTFKRSEAEWSWVATRHWRARYDAHIGDLRKALDWCFSDKGDASLGVDLAVAAIRLWNEQSSIFEQLYQVDRALAHASSLVGASRMAALATSRAWSMTLARQLHAGTDDAWNTASRFAETSGDLGQHLSVICGRAVFLVYTGRNKKALNLLNTLIRVATEAHDRGTVFDGERLRTLAEFHLGKVTRVRDKLEELAKTLALGMSPSRVARYHLQRYVSIHTTLAFSVWLGGQPERALAMVEQMVVETGQIGQLMGQANVLALVGLPLALWSGQFDMLQRYLINLRSDLDLERIALWEPVYQFYESVHQHTRGDLNALVGLRSAVNKLIHDNFLARTPMYLGVLAQALVAAGQPADANDVIDRALALQRRVQETWCLPELLRVKAQVMVAAGERDPARSVLEEARQIALRMGAKAFELRIAIDIAEMRIGDGSSGGVLELLAPVYESFAERTVTEDLRHAARLINIAGENLSTSSLLASV